MAKLERDGSRYILEMDQQELTALYKSMDMDKERFLGKAQRELAYRIEDMLERHTLDD